MKLIGLIFGTFLLIIIILITVVPFALKPPKDRYKKLSHKGKHDRKKGWRCV